MRLTPYNAPPIFSEVFRAAIKTSIKSRFESELPVGEPVEHNQDLFGTTVQLAARLCAHAQPEQILVTSDVYDLCGDHDLDFRELAPYL